MHPRIFDRKIGVLSARLADEARVARDLMLTYVDSMAAICDRAIETSEDVEQVRAIRDACRTAATELRALVITPGASAAELNLLAATISETCARLETVLKDCSGIGADLGLDRAISALRSRTVPGEG